MKIFQIFGIIFLGILIIILTLFNSDYDNVQTTPNPISNYQTSSTNQSIITNTWLQTTKFKHSNLDCNLSIPSNDQISELFTQNSQNSSAFLLFSPNQDQNKHPIESQLDNQEFYLNTTSNSSLCAWTIIITTKNVNPELSPIPDYPKDSIILEAVGKNFMSIGIVSKNSSLDTVINNFNIRAYHTLLFFHDPDSYNITGQLEYVNNEWNFEKFEFVFWDPKPLKFAFLTSSRIQIQNELTVQVSGDLINQTQYENLPICTSGDHPGRFINSDLVLVNEIQSLKTFPELDFMTTFKTKFNHMWLPYSCKYRRLSYSWFNKCLEKNHKVINFFGDSNTRRSLKAITTGGAWCTTWYNSSSSECQCSDWNLQVPFVDANKINNTIYNVSGGNSHFFFYNWQGLQPWGPNWRKELDSEVFHKQYPDFSKPSAVVISAVNWDAGFGTLAQMEAGIKDFILILKTTFQNASIIWRPGQFYSGRSDAEHNDRGGNSIRRLSRMRVEAFNEILGKSLVEQVGAKVWDIYSLGEGLFPESKSRLLECGSNHMTRDGVDLENQILMNMLCPVE